MMSTLQKVRHNTKREMQPLHLTPSEKDGSQKALKSRRPPINFTIYSEYLQGNSLRLNFISSNLST